MDLKKISFCDRISYNVNSNKYKKYILERINYENILTKNNINSYRNSYKQNLLNNDYFISEITRGNPYILFLFKDNLNQNVCLLIDCKICKGHEYPRINLLKYRFDEKLYSGTLFICELLKTDKNWILLINDIYKYCNQNITYSNFITRLEQIYYILNNEYIIDNDIEICEIKIKNYKYKNDIHNFDSKFGYNFIPNNPNLERFKYKFKNNLKNPKSINNSNIVINNNIVNSSKDYLDITKKLTFKIDRGNMPGIYYLYCHNNDKYDKVGVARIVGLRTNEMIQELFNNDNEKKVLCEYNGKFNKWSPLSISSKNICYK